jgi:adenine deaminase
MEMIEPKSDNGCIVSDIEKDILKIVVLNRYKESKPVVGLIKNFGLKKGAMAGSIAHDSHNIIAVGTNDLDIVNSINEIIKLKGGIAAFNGDEKVSLALPIAGLMSDQPAEKVSEIYKQINQKPIEWGSKLHAPFMTMSFMALLVIPELKIGDKGLFDGKQFELTSLFT